MRTDIRLFRLDQFRLAGRTAAPVLTAPTALLTAGRRPGRSMTCAQQPSACRPRSIRSWPGRACSSAASTTLVAEHGDLLRPHLFRGRESAGPTSSPRCTPPAGRAERCSTCRAAWWSTSRCTCFRPCRRRRRSGPRAGRARRRRRSHAAGRNGQRRSTAPACTAAAIEIARRPGAKLRYVNLQNWGTRRLALRPSEGAGRSRRPACNGPSARWAAAWPRSTSTWPWSAKGPTRRSTA